MTTKELSQTPAAIASRKRRADVAAAKKKGKAKAKAKTPPAGDPPAGDPPVDPPADPSTASIGVQTPEKPAAKAAQLYHCPNCDEDVTMAMPECPTCGQIFNWPKGT